MKKTKLFSLILLGLLCCSGAWAADVTISSTFSSSKKPQNGITLSSGGNDYGTVSCNSASSNRAIIRNTSSLTITATRTGWTLKSITLTWRGSNDPASTDVLTISGGKYNSLTSITASANTVVIGSENTTNDYQISAVSVIFTPAADETAPEFISSSPDNGDEDVAVEGTIVLTFSENIASVDGNKFSLSGATKGTVAIDGTDAKKVNIPYSEAGYETTITLSTAAEAVADAAGNKSAALSAISFSTKAAPAVGTISPNGGAQNGNTDVTISGSVGTVYYQWSESSGATIGTGVWTEGTATSTPNVEDTRYLHVYATDGVTNSGITTKTFTLTKIKEAAGLSYETDAVEKTIGDAAFTNTLSNPNSLTVSYSSSNTSVATVDSDGKVTIKAAGSTTITASSAATDDYYAGEASYTLTVNKKAHGLAYATASVSKDLGAANFTNSLTNPNELSVSYSITTTGTGSSIDNETGVVTVGSTPGSETITATFAGNDTFNGGTATYTLTINKASAGLAYATKYISKHIGDDGFTAELTNSHDLTIAYTITSNGTSSTINTSTGAVSVGTSAGIETVTAKFAGNDYYNADSVRYRLIVLAEDEIAIIWAFDDKSTETSAIYSGMDSYFSSNAITKGSNVAFENNLDHCLLNSAGGAGEWINASRVKPSSASENNTLSFTATLANGKQFDPSSVAFVAFKQGTNGDVTLNAKWMSTDVDDATLASGTKLKRSSSSNVYATPGGDRLSYDLSSKPTVSIGGTFGLKIELTTNSKSYGIGDIIITGKPIYASHSINATDPGYYATFCAPYKVSVPTGVEAYTARYSTVNETTGKLTLDAWTNADRRVIPANLPVILKGSSTSIVLTATDAAVDNFSGTNNLRGTPSAALDASTVSTAYVLGVVNETTGFYKKESGTIPVNKAYIIINEGAVQAPQVIRFVEGENNATNIESVEANENVVKFIENGQLFIKKNGVIYDALGRIIR